MRAADPDNNTEVGASPSGGSNPTSTEGKPDSSGDYRSTDFLMSEVHGKGSAQVLFVKTYIDGKEYYSLATPDDVKRAIESHDRQLRAEIVAGLKGLKAELTDEHLYDARVLIDERLARLKREGEPT